MKYILPHMYLFFGFTFLLLSDVVGRPFLYIAWYLGQLFIMIGIVWLVVLLVRDFVFRKEVGTKPPKKS